jgi:hypothetical protein
MHTGTIWTERMKSIYTEPVFVNVYGAHKSISRIVSASRAGRWEINRVVGPACQTGSGFLGSFNVYKYGLWIKNSLFPLSVCAVGRGWNLGQLCECLCSTRPKCQVHVRGGEHFYFYILKIPVPILLPCKYQRTRRYRFCADIVRKKSKLLSTYNIQ